MEYVKNMRIGGYRIKFEWLRLKIEIIKYFRALNATNTDEESKEDEYDTSTRLEDIKSRIKAFSGIKDEMSL